MLPVTGPGSCSWDKEVAPSRRLYGIQFTTKVSVVLEVRCFKMGKLVQSVSKALEYSIFNIYI